MTAARFDAVTFAYIADAPGNVAAASEFCHLQVALLGYASTSWYKNINCDWAVYKTSTGSGTIISNNFTSQWQSTAAINRVTVLGAGAASLATGSVLRVYGRT